MHVLKAHGQVEYSRWNKSLHSLNLLMNVSLRKIEADHSSNIGMREMTTSNRHASLAPLLYHTSMSFWQHELAVIKVRADGNEM